MLWRPGRVGSLHARQRRRCQRRCRSEGPSDVRRRPRRCTRTGGGGGRRRILPDGAAHLSARVPQDTPERPIDRPGWRAPSATHADADVPDPVDQDCAADDSFVRRSGGRGDRRDPRRAHARDRAAAESDHRRARQRRRLGLDLSATAATGLGQHPSRLRCDAAGHPGEQRGEPRRLRPDGPGFAAVP